MMSIKRFSEYRVMWVFVFFDLPTDTKKQRKAAALFRKRIMADGFTMFQFSIYLRHCPSFENAQAHIRRVEYILPAEGKIGILYITDKQFDSMKIFYAAAITKKERPIQQLTLF